ncbi:MAG: DUF308 domain-containing protein [Lactobacillaceae bacterium]|jgi:uncharacterized membrane protein HdeD (DUF308 family)|nr:DUF308 domain-containing protein [Lactobacillaceae bacterium]
MNLFKTAKWTTIIVGILLALIGGYGFFQPVSASVTVILLLGIAAIIRSVTDFVNAFNSQFLRGTHVFAGLLNLIVGIILIFEPGVGHLYFGLLISFWVLFGSIQYIAVSFSNEFVSGWVRWLSVLLGVLGVFASVYLLLAPGLTFLVAIQIASFYLIILAVIMIITGISSTEN